MPPIVQICRHLQVDWLDTHTCRCAACGRTGRWYEEGFVLWRKACRVVRRDPQVSVNWETADSV